MSKATNKGTCQVCGCIQKLPSGHISLHGYTTRWGFFSGTCHGSRALPFEQSKDLIEAAIARAEARAKATRERQDALRAPVAPGTTKAFCNLYFPCKSRGDAPSHYRFAEVEITFEDTQVEGRKQRTFYRGTLPGAFECGKINQRVGKYSDTEIEVVIRELNSRFADSLNKQLAEIANYVKWQRERIKDWAPRPLLSL